MRTLSKNGEFSEIVRFVYNEIKTSEDDTVPQTCAMSVEFLGSTSPPVFRPD